MLVSVLPAIAPSLAQAQQESCIDIIKFSRTSDIVQRSEEELSSQARAFCNEYRSSKGNTKSLEASGSYKLFSASFGQSSSSVETLASTYCGSDSSNDKRGLAYSRHLELISGDAYRAYQQCNDSNNRATGLVFTLQSATETVAHFRAYHKNVVSAGMVRVVFEITPDGANVTAGCRVVGADGSTASTSGSMSLLPTQGRLITCTRTSAVSRTSITFNNQDGNDALNYVWPAYQKGVPFDALARFREEAKAHAKAIQDQLTALRANLRGVVIPFEAAQCPPDWRPYTKAYGRFIRGLDVSGGTDPEKRQPGSLQGDELKAHTHALRLPHERTYRGGDAGPGDHAGGLEGRATSSVGGPETRPKNVALLYCTPEW